MIPDQLGPYRIEKKIGSGGMGTVYLARHVETGEQVAVKVLPASLAREEGFVARFNREIESLKKLDNPWVVKLYESGVEGDIYYYAMEYVDGDTLTNRLIRDKRIPWRETVDIAIQVCYALKAAHDAGIIHRDLKPSNLMITSEGTVKLTDFGVAQVFASNRLTATGGIIGTAEYMSPEQAQGKRAIKQSDIYSLGAVMYVMLTGRPPFSGKTTVELIQKHRYAQFDRPRLIVPEIPHWLEEVICKCMEKEPENRYPDAFVLSRRLREVIKKVEISQEQHTYEFDAASAISETLAMEPGTRDQLAATEASEQRGPGVGTMVRNLVREEIKSGKTKENRWEHLFDETWILVGVLVLIVIGGVFWFRDTEMTAAEKFEAGVALMDEEAGAGWVRAKEEFFEPLLKDDEEEWKEKVDPYLKQIEIYELQRKLSPKRKLSLRRVETPESEPERILNRVEHYRQLGQFTEAKQTLNSLRSLVADDPQQKSLVELIDQLLSSLDVAVLNIDERKTWIRQALQRADQALQENQPDKAREILTAVVTLYGQDADVAELAAEAKTQLEKIPPAEKTDTEPEQN